MLFQFQIGAIRRHLHSISKNIVSSFNSKLVRLEVQAGLEQGCKLRRFNSKLVRLEVCELCIVGNCETSQFQFQIGAIRSLDRFFSSRSALHGFNSKLVRLEGDYRFSHTIEERQFQFQIGAIRRSNLRMSCRVNLCFNSKLVRLEAS